MCFSLRKTPFFFFAAPGLGLGALLSQCWLVFLLVGMVTSTCGGVRGECLGRLLRPVDSPRFKCLGCRFTWSPWLLLYRAVASVTFRLRAASAAAPVHHTLRQPGFPRKLRLRGCRRWLRLWILSGRSPLGRSLCSVSFFSLVSFYPSG